MQILHQFQAKFEQYLEANQFYQQPQELYDPVNYILGLGGKRLRPLVLMLGYSMFDKAVEKSLPAAFAIELFHNFSLLHDDIMDAAPLRRGKPTVHEKFSLNAGILSGDVMFVKAYEYLLMVERKEVLVSLLDTFTRCAVEVCEGQQMDMNFETCGQVTIPEYLKMIELKTSVLVGAALKMGALLGGATPNDASLLYAFGLDLGIAFQLQDDLLDTFGDPLKFGKKTGGDIAQNKKTYLYLKSLEIAGESLNDQLRQLYQPGAGLSEPEKIAAVTGIFQQTGVRQITENLQEKYRRNAFAHLEKVNADPDKKRLLEDFGWWLMNRES